MPEASSFFMSRAAGDTLEQFGTKKACISGCDFDVVPATSTVPQEQVPFQEVAGLDAVQAECVLKMAKMKPGSATLFKPSKRTLGYGELRAAGFVKMESLVLECFPNATPASIEFVDLGSGLGTVVAFAAIIAGWHAKGIEMCPQQHQAAEAWFVSTLMPEFPKLAMAGRLKDTDQLLCGDMRAAEFGSMIHQANVIFMNNLLFDDVSTGASQLHSAVAQTTPHRSSLVKSSQLHSTAMHSTPLQPTPHCAPALH